MFEVLPTRNIRFFAVSGMALLANILLCLHPACGAPLLYQVELTGVEEGALRDTLLSVSDTMALITKPPASIIQLRRRAERDRGRFLDALHSQGYYGAESKVSIEESAAPVKVNFTVTPGPQYTFGLIEVMSEQPNPLPAALTPEGETIGLRTGEPAAALPIVRANELLLDHLRARGYPGPKVANRDVVVRHVTQTVDVRFLVDPGSASVYGELRIEGLSRVKARVIEELLPWEEGDSYEQSHTDQLRTRLYATQLFSTVSVKPAHIDEERGIVAMSVNVVERPPRTISAGLEFKTDEGLGTQFHWEHRNIRGLGHRLSLDATIATERREIITRYRIDRFRREDQALTLLFGISQEEYDAYESDSVSGLVFVERTVTPHLTVGAGIGLRLSQVQQRDEEENFALLYAPFEARLDHTNDPLDATRGFRLSTRIEPYIDVVTNKNLFLKADTEFSYYIPMGTYMAASGKPLDDWIFAFRIRLGLLAGASTAEVPANVRFYSGGGGSLRGYPYQTVGPLDGNDPVGGRSLMETSFEVRKRITEKVGFVAFLDGGSAFDASWPDFSEDLAWGAGVGLRVFTALGPLRVDAAVPLNSRSGLDDAFQLYMSIGQAF